MAIKISAKSSYAVSAMCELTVHYPATVKSERIAKERTVPRQFLLKVLRELVDGGLVTVTRGPSGGYGLSREPSDIYLGDVLRILQEEVSTVVDGTVSATRTSEKGQESALGVVWAALHTNINIVLNGVTLAEIASQNLPREIGRLAKMQEFELESRGRNSPYTPLW